MASIRLPDEGTSLVTGAPTASSTTTASELLSKRNLWVLGGLLAVIVLILGLSFGLVKPTKEVAYSAVARIDNGTIQGTVSFSQAKSGGAVTITLALRGIPASNGWNSDPKKVGGDPFLHGMHIHNKSDLANDCNNTGGHLNLGFTYHAGPSNTTRHTGDLGNHVTEADKSINKVFTDSVISLVPGNAADVTAGRAFVIHADSDDYGLGGFGDSLTSGHAGLRLACGVIKRTS